jgi:hypothetical protein
MVKYKLQYREKGQKRFYNFGPTVNSSAKPRYSQIDTMAKAKSVKRELEKAQDYRVWRIRKK